MRPTSSYISNSRPLKLLTRFWRDDRGVNAIEFAFVMPILVALLLITTQIAVIFVAQSYIETVAEAGMRLVLTNQAQSGGWSQATFQTNLCKAVTAMFNCNNLIVSLQVAPASASAMAASMPQFDSTGKLSTTLPYQVSALAPGVKGMLVVMYQWPVIGGPLGVQFSSLGNGMFLLVATQVFQIEPSTS